MTVGTFLATTIRRHALLIWGGTAVTALVCLWLGKTRDITFQIAAAGANQRVVFHHEDGGGIVEVYEERHTGYRTLRSSRLRQEGGDHPESLIVQRLQGALPVLLHAHPRRLLVVGLGTGISLATSLRPEVEHVTCIELSEGIIRAAALFEHANERVIHHPKVTVVRQDGRNFLALTHERYDLIVQDLFFPYRAGVGNLYTREHYLRVRERLTAGGRVGQWIALNQVGLFCISPRKGIFQLRQPELSGWELGSTPGQSRRSR